MQLWNFAPVAGAILLIASAGTGCATKKYVRQRVDPVNQRVSEVEKQSNDKIAGLDEKTSSGISRVDEKATSAGARANEAAQAASRAGDQATEAGKAAENARGLAEKGLSRSDELARTIDNLDNFQQVSSESVLFNFGKATLTPDGKAKLDQMAQTLATNRHYVVQVEGYTDATGPSEYNMELSRRRANAVAQYLTLEHKIPLYRIHMAGFGKAVPVAQNNSRNGRKQNRRVDVRVFAPQLTAGAGQPAAGSASTTTGNPTQ
jgi:OmpA-OmpF porin, OOP family